MATTRYRRKDLKRPDEFISTARRVLTWGAANTRRVYQILGAAIAVLVIVGGFYSLRGARVRQANDDLAMALAPLRAGNNNEAATRLAEVANRWDTTGPGQAARLFAAGAAIKANNFETVGVLLDGVPASEKWPSYLRQQALVNMGFALEQKADFKGAAGRYAEAAGVNGPYSAAALLGEARCREQLGEAAAAQALYERFTREFPEAAELERISLKLDPTAG